MSLVREPRHHLSSHPQLDQATLLQPWIASQLPNRGPRDRTWQDTPAGRANCAIQNASSDVPVCSPLPAILLERLDLWIASRRIRRRCSGTLLWAGKAIMPAEIEECRRSSEPDDFSDFDFELDSEKRGVRVEVAPISGPGRGCKVIDGVGDGTSDRSLLSRATQVLAGWGVETNGCVQFPVMIYELPTHGSFGKDHTRAAAAEDRQTALAAFLHMVLRELEHPDVRQLSLSYSSFHSSRQDGCWVVGARALWTWHTGRLPCYPHC